VSQHDLVIDNAAGASVRTDLNNALQALGSRQSGASAPSTTYAHMLWVDTTNGVVKRRNAANSGWIVVETNDETFVLSRSSNTMLDVSDWGKTIRATGSYTQTFDAVATLGDGWGVEFRVESGATLTLDPNSTETIDGATTLAIDGPWAGKVVCNGSALYTVGANLAATQAQQEAASSAGVFVTPARQHYHPSAAKAWQLASTAGTSAAAFNCDAPTDAATGQVVINVTTDFTSANWCAIGQGLIAAGGGAASTYVTHTSGQTAGSVTLTIVRLSDYSPVDPTQWNFIGFGDQ